MFVYRNSSTGQVVELPERDVRLDHLDVWLLIAEPDPDGGVELRLDTLTVALVDPREPERCLSRPDEGQPKAAWVAYAVARGMSESDAKHLSKAALIEEFGREDEEDR